MLSLCEAGFNNSITGAVRCRLMTLLFLSIRNKNKVNMKKIYRLYLLFLPALIAAVSLQAQTNPAAVALPFGLSSQSSAALPVGVAVHRFASIPTTRTTAEATGGDLPSQGSSPTNNAGGWYYLGNDGIGLLASGTNPAGAVIVAINTSGSSNISVSWNCKTQYNQSSRDNSVALQYRVGSTGSFTNVGTTSTYSSTGKTNGDTSPLFTEALPAAANNQPLVQVRWVYWESNGSSGSRDKISVDNISINGSTSPSCAAPQNLSASGITSSGASFSWNAVSGAASYEYAVSTSATPPGSGTGTSNTSVNVSGLNPATNYYFHVRAICSGSSTSNWTSISFSTGNPGVCTTPLNLSSSGINANGGDFSWSAVSSAVSYEYAVIASAIPPGSGTIIGTNSISVSGLSPATSYYFHVRAICSETSVSNWASIGFTTTSGQGNPDEFTLMTYNVLNYPGSTGPDREPAYRTIVNDVQPDILVLQELAGSTGNSNFLSNVLNYSGSVYTAASFVDGPDSDNGLYYKSSLFQFISNTPIPTTLRDISQYKLRHMPTGDTLIIFSVHLKASNLPSDEQQRTDEVDDLRAVTDVLPAGKDFLVCGDFNIYGATETAYQHLIGNGNNANGKFYDLLNLSGTWNNSSYAIHHTQSPRTTSFGGGATGGMDDRFDMVLFSNAIMQSGDFEIVSNTYKAYGNDGQHYNQALNTPPYNMYTSTISGALHDASDHLPVVVKMKHTGSVPARIAGNAATFEQVVRAFPNPARNTLYLTLNGSIGHPVSLVLHDMSGRIVRTATLDNHQTIGVDLSGLNTGIYYLRSAQLDGVQKIVVY